MDNDIVFRLAVFDSRGFLINFDKFTAKIVELAGETMNCYVFEPEEGSELVSKVYIRKSVFVGKPRSIMISVEASD